MPAVLPVCEGSCTNVIDGQAVGLHRTTRECRRSVLAPQCAIPNDGLMRMPLALALVAALAGAAPMTDDESKLSVAQTRAAEFHATQDPELLVLAYKAISQVSSADEKAPDTRIAIQVKALHAWLRLLDLVGRSMDFTFDLSPRISPIIAAPTGRCRTDARADPLLVRDPVARWR